MTTQPPTLTDFLLARIAEDEADPWRGAELIGSDRVVEQAEYDALRREQEEWESRVLSECEAKRRIVALNDADYPTLNDAYGCDDSCAIPYVLRILALPYADHPDWREEWRP